MYSRPETYPCPDRAISSHGRRQSPTPPEEMRRILSHIGQGFLWIAGNRSFDPIYRVSGQGVEIAAHMPFRSELGEIIIEDKEFRRVKKLIRRGKMHRYLRKEDARTAPVAIIISEGGVPGQRYHYYRSLYFNWKASFNKGIPEYYTEDFCWGPSLLDIATAMVRMRHLLIQARPPTPWYEMDTETLSCWYSRYASTWEGLFHEEQLLNIEYRSTI